MRIHVKKTTQLQGIITPPASKSEAIRAIFFALLARGTSTIHGITISDDIQDALNICDILGAQIQKENNSIKITSQGTPFNPLKSHLFTGNSGVTTRFILPLIGLRADPHTPMQIDCGEQMRSRPINGLLNALQHLGMKIESLHLPTKISGNLIGGDIVLNEPISQYLSALLIALPLAEKNSTIRMANIPARSYIDMTLDWLTRLNIKYLHHYHNNIDTVSVPSNQQYPAFEYTLSGDFSNASYFMAAGVMFNGSIRLKGLNMHDKQGDKKMIDIIQSMGGDITVENNDIIIQGSKPLTGIAIDASNIPDLLPTLAVLGTVAYGKTEIMNVAQARLKETDRIHSMTDGLRRMGAHIEEKQDGMIIYASSLKGTQIKGYGDHRTVMALSLAGMLASGETMIDDGESINKTFPTFIEMMKKLGAHMEAIK